MRRESRESALGNTIALAAIHLIATLLLGVGCSTPDKHPLADLDEAPLQTADGLARVEANLPGVLFVREDHGIGSYDAFLIPESKISYRSDSTPLPTELEFEFLAMLEQTLVDAATEASIPIEDEPGLCTMEVSMVLADVDIEPSRRERLGELTLVMEFRDTLTGAPLLRYATEGTIAQPPEGTTRSDQVLATFAKMVAAMDVSRAFGGAGVSEGTIRPGCNGTLAQRGTAARTAVSTGP